MMMVRGGREARRGVAARAQQIGRSRDVQAVRVVAVSARDAGLVHAALQERTVFVNLVLLLAVGVIQMLVEQRRFVRLHEGTPGNVILRQRAAPCVTTRAGFELSGRLAGFVATRDAGGGIHDPCVSRLAQVGKQPHGSSAA